ncbi:MAG TPA: DUF4142 domain-containing protein [Segetibacter sp.]|jgi:putative membrane protein
MKFRKVIVAGCLLGGVALSSCGKDDNEELNNTDRDFMIKSSISNNAEVGAATLAVNKATNLAVKAYATHMLMEHGMAQTDLKNLGNSVSYPIKDTLDPAHVAIANQLSMLSGRQFDSAYIHTQVVDHQVTLTNFQNEQNNGQHRDVKNYANTYRPHIEAHLVRADSIATSFYRR